MKQRKKCVNWKKNSACITLSKKISRVLLFLKIRIINHSYTFSTYVNLSQLCMHSFYEQSSLLEYFILKCHRLKIHKYLSWTILYYFLVAFYNTIFFLLSNKADWLKMLTRNLQTLPKFFSTFCLVDGGVNSINMYRMLIKKKLLPDIFIILNFRHLLKILSFQTK